MNIRSIDNSIKRCGNCLYCEEDWNYEGCWVCRNPVNSERHAIKIAIERDDVCDEWTKKEEKLQRVQEEGDEK